MILKWHVPFYREIFLIPGFLQDPILTFGYQGIDGPSSAPQAAEPFLSRVQRFLGREQKVKRLAAHFRSRLESAPALPPDFQFPSLSSLLMSRGHSVTTLDLFDSRADLRYDMNQPVPQDEHSRYGTLMDIGCLEHLFDTAACMENCMRMLRRGGYYLLHTPVNGYFGHGLHVFNPQGLMDCFVANGFEIVYRKYSTTKGKPVTDPSQSPNVILWLVGRKREELSTFVCPQQTVWATDYYPQGQQSAGQNRNAA